MVYDKCVEVASELKAAAKRNIEEHFNKTGHKKKLAIITGNREDFASQKYVQTKVKGCEEIGADSQVIYYGEPTNETDILSCLFKSRYNREWDNERNVEHLEDNCDGVIIQLPLAKEVKHLTNELINRIEPTMDVDGLTDFSKNELSLKGTTKFIPCTALGVLKIIEYRFGKDGIAGKNVVIINRSDLIGKPLAYMLLARNATVTICHSHSVDIRALTQCADIIITAVGKQNFIDESYFDKTRTTFVVDCAIVRDENGKVCGDCNKNLYDENVKFAECTPVPRGVGLTTVASLLYNLSIT